MIIAGGGTGGHIFPAIAIANALKKIDEKIEILFVGAKGKMEMEKVPEAGYKIEGLDIAGFNRSSLIKNVGLPFKLAKSFLQVRSIVKRFKPDSRDCRGRNFQCRPGQHHCGSRTGRLGSDGPRTLERCIHDG